MSRVPQVAASAVDGDGRSKRWDAHRAERRAELCQAARKAVHHGGPDLSMDELAAAMGTSKSIVYRYFSDKAGLQAAVGAVVLDDIAEAFGATAHDDVPARQRLEQMVAIYVRMVTSSPNVYRFITPPGGTGADVSMFLAGIAEYVASPLRTVLVARGHDPSFAEPWAVGVIGFVRAAVESWLLRGPSARFDPETLIDVIGAWLWAGAEASLPALPTLPTPTAPDAPTEQQ